jgi:S-adenosylmethionine uptake transporter
MAPRQNNLHGAGLALASFGIYATGDAIVKYMGASYSPFQNIFFSCLFSFPLVAVMLAGDGREGNLIPKKPGLMALRSILGVVNILAGFTAFAYLPMSEAYPIFFAAPILVTLFAIPMLGEKIGWQRGAAVALGLIGVVVALRPGEAGFGIGHVAAITAAVIFAFNSVLMRKTGGEERTVVLMIDPMFANLIVTGLALPFFYEPMPITHLGLLAGIALTGFFGGILSVAAYRRAQAAVAASMQYSQIIWATVFGVLLFDDTFETRKLIGTAIIIASGIWIVMREGTPTVQSNRVVSETKGRFELGVLPRLSLWSRLPARLTREDRNDLS